MLNSLLSAPSLLLLIAASPALPSWDAAKAMLQQQQARQQQVTIHVPRVTTTTTTIILRAPSRPPMVEKNASDCVKVEKIAGFAVTERSSVDLVLTNGSVLRAKFGNECPALGFYTGFYVKAADDRRICANRDSFRSRSGKACNVRAFKRLVPAQ